MTLIPNFWRKVHHQHLQDVSREMYERFKRHRLEYAQRRCGSGSAWYGVGTALVPRDYIRFQASQFGIKSWHSSKQLVLDIIWREQLHQDVADRLWSVYNSDWDLFCAILTWGHCRNSSDKFAGGAELAHDHVQTNKIMMTRISCGSSPSHKSIWNRSRKPTVAFDNESWSCMNCCATNPNRARGRDWNFCSTCFMTKMAAPGFASEFKQSS